MPRIFLKSRPPIGRELRILASDWSRGSPKISKGGTLTILNLCQWIIFEDLLHCQWRPSDTVTLKWHSDTLLKIKEMRHSSQRMAPRSFPSIEGNSRGARPWVEIVIDWHPSGLSDTGVVQVAYHWQIRSPLAYLAMDWFKWHPGDTVTLQWHSGTKMTNVHNETFISGGGSSVVSLYRGKQPRSQLKRWNRNLVASQWLKWHRSGSSDTSLTNWQSIGIIGNKLG